MDTSFWQTILSVVEDNFERTNNFLSQYSQEFSFFHISFTNFLFLLTPCTCLVFLSVLHWNLCFIHFSFKPFWKIGRVSYRGKKFVSLWKREMLSRVACCSFSWENFYKIAEFFLSPLAFPKSFPFICVVLAKFRALCLNPMTL